MALRKINNRYYVYWKENGRIFTRSLKTSDATIAKRQHDLYIQMLQMRRSNQVLFRDFPEILGGINASMTASAPEVIPTTGGLMLRDMTKALGIIEDLPRTKRNAIDRFVKWCKERKIQHCRDVTPEIAMKYLEENYGSRRNFKSFNNNRGILNRAFSHVLVKAKMLESPFKVIPMRAVRDVISHRALTDQEFSALLNATSDIQRRVLLCLGFYAGCDYSTATALTWEEVDLSIPLIRRRRVKSGTMFAVGIHAELLKEIQRLPQPTDKSQPLLGGYSTRAYNDFLAWFAPLMKELNITDTDEGKASFHSLRSSFFTRCDRFGISRRTANLAGGHLSDRMTDIYSHDTAAALEICSLPAATPV